MSVLAKIENQAALAKSAIEEVLEVYPDKAATNRAKHLGVQDDRGCNVNANRKAEPGVMTSRGCAYAGSKGVVWGPIKDMMHISHGPVGCGYYSWAGRRNYYNGSTGVDAFGAMNITSDFQEKDIVFGGDKKLEKIIHEIETLFPLARGITVQSECPVGLIGDDIEAVSKKTAAALGKPVIPSRCEGFRGVSQSLGHHIANDGIRDWVLDRPRGLGASFEPGPYDVSLIGDYNIGGDAWSSRLVIEEMGLRVVSQWTGDGTLSELENGPKGRLILLHCYRSMNYLTRYMEEHHGLPYLEFNLFGPTQIEKSLRAIAARFDERIQENAEKVIARYKPTMDALIAKYRPRLEGKKVMIFVGGLRPRHTVDAFHDLGMEVVGTGYEFAHKDDYQRTANYTKEGTLIYDDVNHFELDRFVERLAPDLVASGIKEKYVFHKQGLPFRQMHSYDYSGPYHGYDGFAIFARDMDMTVNNPVWSLVRDPWA